MTWTCAEIECLIEEYQEDLLTYKIAYDALIRRIRDVEGSAHEDRFTKTSGCQAALHVLIMNMSSTEGLIEDLKQNLEWMRDVRNTRKDG